MKLSKRLVATIGLFISPGLCLAQAQDDQVPEFNVYTQADLILDNNVFRVADEDAAQALYGDSEMADSIRRIAVGLQARKPLSRQAVTADAEIYRLDYDYFDSLSHTAGFATLGWDWLWGDRLVGRVDAGYQRRVQDFSEARLSLLDIRNEHSLRMTGTYLFTRAWRLKLSAVTKDQKHKLDERSALNRTINRGVAEFKYFSTKKSSVGIRSSFAQADFPNRQNVNGRLFDNSYSEYENKLVADWRYSPASTFKGNIGQTVREYDDLSERDFSGATWQLSYLWKPRKRYLVEAMAWRGIEAFADQVTSYVLEDGLSVTGQWSVTPVTTLSASLAAMQRNYDGDPGQAVTTGPRRSDDVLRYSVAGEFSVRQNLLVNVGLDYEERDSNTERWDFDCYTFALGVRATFF